MPPPARSWLAPAALALASLSLLVNLILIWQLAHPQRLIAPALTALTEELVNEQGVISYTVEVPIGTPLDLDIPVDERFTVDIDTVIPLNTSVRVPIRGPLGVANVNVPIRANVPLRARLPLHIQHTFRLRTETTRPISVPIRIRPADLLR